MAGSLMASKSPVEQSTTDAQRDPAPAPLAAGAAGAAGIAGPASRADDAAPGRPSASGSADDHTPFARTSPDPGGLVVEPAPRITEAAGEAAGERFALGTEIGRGGMGRV